jgi:hypothetical protein
MFIIGRELGRAGVLPMRSSLLRLETFDTINLYDERLDHL